MGEKMKARRSKESAPALARNRGRKLEACKAYRSLGRSQPYFAVWQREASRLASEYIRTGRELRRLAFLRHMGGMLLRFREARIDR